MSQSERWRVTVLVNEHGSMVADYGPGVRPLDVMPVAEHEALVAENVRYRLALTVIASARGPLIEADPATLGHGFEQIAKEALGHA